MGGKSLIIAHQIDDCNVLLVGGGEVGLTRLRKLISTGSKVTLVSPEIHTTIEKEYCVFSIEQKDNIHKEWDKYGKKRSVYRVIKDVFKEEYLTLYQDGKNSGWSLILTCIPDQIVSEKIYTMGKEMFGDQQMINVADNPRLCDFYFGANLEFGKNDQNDSLMQLMISSNGMGPRFISMLRDEIATMFSGIDFETSLSKLGELRMSIRSVTNNETDIKYRMEWMKKCTEIFGVRNCQKIDTDKLFELFKDMYKNDKSLIFPSNETMFNEYTKKEFKEEN